MNQPQGHTPISLRNHRKAIVKSRMGLLLFIIVLALILNWYLFLNFDQIRILCHTYARALIFFLVSLILLITAWFLISLSFKKGTNLSLQFSCIVLSPVVLLLVLLPYHYIPIQSSQTHPLSSIVLILLCQITFWLLLRQNSQRELPKGKKPYIFLILLVGTCVIIFNFLSIAQYRHFQHFNAPDVGLYNQIQWNNLNGHLFENSTSGSNFVTHNSPFLILLTPLYAIYPRPEMLIILKNIFLGLSVLPFSLLIKNILGVNSLIPLAGVCLFYPFLAAQNFAAPHEICFLPPFLLFSFYFYKTQRFHLFLIFLLLSLSIKEHLALLSVAYGIYALFEKRTMRWVMTPIILGFLWGVFSLWLISHVQQIYLVDLHPAWFIENLKNRFFDQNQQIINIWKGLKTSNLGNIFNLSFAYQLFSPLSIVFPVWNPVFWLGVPELIINLLSDRLIFFPIWHYHIIVSCFFLIGTLMTINHLSHKLSLIYPAISKTTFQKLFSWLLFFCVLTHYILWTDLARFEKNPEYKRIIAKALALIPPHASVSVPKHLAAHVSSRREYFILGDKRRGEYIVLEDNNTLPSFKIGKENPYRVIFREGTVRLLKRMK